MRTFGLGVFTAFAAAAAISVYVFGQVERMKGPHTTFTMLIWAALAVALVATGAYWAGSRVWRFAPSRYSSFFAGALVSLLFWLLPLARGVVPEEIVIALTWVACLGGSFVAPRLLRAMENRFHAPIG